MQPKSIGMDSIFTPGKVPPRAEKLEGKKPWVGDRPWLFLMPNTL